MATTYDIDETPIQRLEQAASALRRALRVITQYGSTLEKADQQRQDLPEFLSSARNALDSLKDI